ncbi:MAG: hypothetical protein JSR09_09475 [Bacteroidetes bacterium]|nr:hypothetical protein [Bacteroidota bacterium]MBS1649919.1 hypothetical protein [Bacteroidota bacterium]
MKNLNKNFTQKIIILFCCVVFFCVHCFAQINPELKKDSIIINPKDSVKEKDLGDVYRSIFKPQKEAKNDSANTQRKYQIAFVPAVGYTLQTGFAAVLSANMAYQTDTGYNTKISSVNTSFTYSQYKQTIIPFVANIWTKGNRWNIISDFRYINYPSNVFGLGGRTDPNKGVTINFQALKIHQAILKSLSNDFYIGAGFYLDKFWDIKAIDPLTRTENKQLQKELGTTESAVGWAFRVLHDTRKNQINPDGGSYYNIVFRKNLKDLGSDSASQTLLIDARTYFRFPDKSKNVLAFWTLDWLSPSQTPPYLLLPSTGWDDQYNTGRGYIQGRFRGKTMIYFESEYRFGITRNGLLGGVAFTNLQSFSSDISNQFSSVFIGYGIGLRIKLNKHSGANLCLDYGWGQNGSGGFFVNLGEVF